MRNIQQINNKYHIIKVLFGIRINYGTYKTLKEAEKQKIILEKNNWIKNKKTGYILDAFPKYTLEKQENNYLIKEIGSTKTYGFYENMKYAQLIQEILPYYDKNVNIEQVEEYARKKYYQYINQDKKGRWRLTIKKRTICRERKLEHILQERDIHLETEESDEEALCNTDTYHYDEPHPPLPKKENFTRSTSNNKQTYRIQKNTKNLTIRIGPYDNEHITRHIHEILTMTNWNKKTVDYIKTITRTIQQSNRNIRKYKDKYIIIHKNERYYTTIDKYMAKYVRDVLEKHDWDKNVIVNAEKEYYTNKNKINQEIYRNNMDYIRDTKPKLQQNTMKHYLPINESIITKEEYLNIRNKIMFDYTSLN